MNVNIRLSPGWRELFRSLGKGEIKELFEKFRQNEFQKLAGADSNESLTDLQSRVRLINELENFFLSVRSSAATSTPNESDE